MKNLLFILTMAIMSTACNNNGNKNDGDVAAPGSFGFDLHFLRENDSSLVQLTNGDASVLVSPRYQAKVFTSTASGSEGKSFGWINYRAFNAAPDPHMNAFGGANRLWLGPEGGKYSLFFKKGDSMVFSNWKTPAAIDTEAWNVTAQDNQQVTMEKEMKLNNFTGATLDIQLQRSVSLLNKNSIQERLGIDLNDSIKFVGYSTNNILKNTGSEAWSEETGMPCIWILDMFNPSDSTVIMIPHKPGKGERVATTDYFGEIGEDRLLKTDSAIFFRADGKKRGKLGILPAYTLPVAGSYDAENRVLTITKFTVDPTAKYLNQEWNTVKPPFSGDAMNAYNDGPLDDGSQMGPFYELESVSPAAALKPGEQQEHAHDVFHFTGSPEQLNSISHKVLGIDLEMVQQAFKKLN